MGYKDVVDSISAGLAKVAKAVLSPFPPEKPVSFGRGKLQGFVTALDTDPDFTGMGIALVDMTKASNEFAGLQHRMQMYGASLVKIVAMFAAFTLRERVRMMAAFSPGKKREEFFRDLTLKWKNEIETRDPKRAKDFPKFALIFNKASEKAGELDFNDDFKEQLRLMIVWSDNHAAAQCIRRLGYQYINGALATAGLFDKVGLWLGADYDYGRVFGEIPVDPGVNPAVHEPPNPKRPGLRTTQGATAEAVAKFLTLVETSQLVTPADAKSTPNREMRLLMEGQQQDSPFKKGLTEPSADPLLPGGYTLTRFYSKIGIGYNVTDDCAFVERKAVIKLGPKVEKMIKYVAVGLRPSNWTHQKRLILKLDECIIKNNA